MSWYEKFTDNFKKFSAKIEKTAQPFGGESEEERLRREEQERIRRQQEGGGYVDPEAMQHAPVDVPAEPLQRVPEENILPVGREDAEEVEEVVEENEVVDEEGIVGDEELLTQQIQAPPEEGEYVTTDPTVLEDFEIPVTSVPTIRNRLATINKNLRNMLYPEIKIEFVGEAYQKPVQYRNRTVNEDFVKVKISGTLPSPSEEIQVKTQEPKVDRKGNPVLDEKGNPVMKTSGHEPKGVRLVAKVLHHEIKEPEQMKYLQTLPPESNLRRVIEEARAKGETPFFNQVEALEGAPPIDGQFWYSSPQDCHACKVRKAGQTARKSTYVGAVVSPNQMTNKTTTVTDADGTQREVTATRNINRKKKVVDPETGKKVTRNFVEQVPIRMIRDEDVQNAAQEQFGGKCIDPFDAVKLITSLKNWVKKTKNAGENYQEKKRKSTHKGGETGGYQTENLFATAVNLMRDPDYQNNPFLLASRMTWKTRYYEATRKENFDPNDYRNRRAVSQAPKVTDEDRSIAKDILMWWRNKLGGIDLDPVEKNKITLSIVSKINQKGKNMLNVANMVQDYFNENNIQLEPIVEEPEQPRLGPQPGNPFGTPAVETPQETILGDPVNALPVAEEPAVEEEPIVEEEPVAEEPAIEGLVDIDDVPEGGEFRSRLKLVSNEEKTTARGRPVTPYYMINFVDDLGRKYYAFGKTRFPGQPRSDVNVKGKKGKKKYYRGSSSTQLHNITPIQGNTPVPEAPVAPEAPITPTPEVEAPVAPIAPTPEVEAPVAPTPEVAPEAAPTGLPKWYGKVDLGNLAEERILSGRDRKGELVTPSKVIKDFLTSLGQISDRFSQPEARAGYEKSLNTLLQKDPEGGKEKVITILKQLSRTYGTKKQ